MYEKKLQIFINKQNKAAFSTAVEMTSVQRVLMKILTEQNQWYSSHSH